MRILMIGDIVGRPGREIVSRVLPQLRVREGIDFVVANGENADSAGLGITPEMYSKLLAAGVDCVTLGDHIYRKREIQKVLETQGNIVKPANFPAEAPGKEAAVLSCGAVPIAVLSLLGRVFMRPVDCPFKAADRVLASLPPEVKVILVDFHAEATSDKQLLGRYLDGRVSAVVGTHTHVTTADEQIFPKGTAFQCDLGMTGPYDSILGRRYDKVLETTLTFNPVFFDVATGDVQLHGSIIDVDPATGRATAIRRLVARWDEFPENGKQAIAGAQAKAGS